MKLKALQFVVVMLLAFALVPVGAHLLALPNKIDLPQAQYFVVQAIYLGWAFPTGIVLVGAIAATLVLTVLQRGQGPRFGCRSSRSYRSPPRWWSFSPGLSLLTPRQSIGPSFRPTGTRCAHNGSTRAPSMLF